MNKAIATGTFLVLAVLGSWLTPLPMGGGPVAGAGPWLDFIYWTVVLYWPALLVALVGALIAYLLATLVTRWKAS